VGGGGLGVGVDALLLAGERLVNTDLPVIKVCVVV
jgi:hypothetical protein